MSETQYDDDLITDLEDESASDEQQSDTIDKPAESSSEATPDAPKKIPRAEKRINQLLHEKKLVLTEREKLQHELAQRDAEMAVLRKQLAETTKSKAENDMVFLQNELKTALDSGKNDEAVKIMSKMTELASAKSSIPASYDDQPENNNQSQNNSDSGYTITESAKNFISKNESWLNVDTERTAIAQKIINSVWTDNNLTDAEKWAKVDKVMPVYERLLDANVDDTDQSKFWKLIDKNLSQSSKKVAPSPEGIGAKTESSNIKDGLTAGDLAEMESYGLKRDNPAHRAQWLKSKRSNA